MLKLKLPWQQMRVCLKRIQTLRQRSSVATKSVLALLSALDPLLAAVGTIRKTENPDQDQEIEEILKRRRKSLGQEIEKTIERPESRSQGSERMTAKTRSLNQSREIEGTIAKGRSQGIDEMTGRMSVAEVAPEVATAEMMHVPGAVQADDGAGAEEEVAEMIGERKGAPAGKEGVPAGGAGVLAENGAPVVAKALAKKLGTAMTQSHLLLMFLSLPQVQHPLRRPLLSNQKMVMAVALLKFGGFGRSQNGTRRRQLCQPG